MQKKIKKLETVNSFAIDYKSGAIKISTIHGQEKSFTEFKLLTLEFPMQNGEAFGESSNI